MPYTGIPISAKGTPGGVAALDASGMLLAGSHIEHVASYQAVVTNVTVTIASIASGQMNSGDQLMIHFNHYTTSTSFYQTDLELAPAGSGSWATLLGVSEVDLTTGGRALITDTGEAMTALAWYFDGNSYGPRTTAWTGVAVSDGMDIRVSNGAISGPQHAAVSLYILRKVS